MTGAVFSYKLRYIVGFWLVEMAISTNQKPTIYRNLYENTDPGYLLYFESDNPSVGDHPRLILSIIIEWHVFNPYNAGGQKFFFNLKSS